MGAAFVGYGDANTLTRSSSPSYSPSLSFNLPTKGVSGIKDVLLPDGAPNNPVKWIHAFAESKMNEHDLHYYAEMHTNILIYGLILTRSIFHCTTGILLLSLFGRSYGSSTFHLHLIWDLRVHAQSQERLN